MDINTLIKQSKVSTISGSDNPANMDTKPGPMPGAKCNPSVP